MAAAPGIVHHSRVSAGEGIDAAIARSREASVRGGARLCGAAAALLPLGAIDDAYGVSARLVQGELGGVDPWALVLAAWFIVVAVLLGWRLRVDARSRRWAPVVAAILLVIAALRLGGSPTTAIAVALAIAGVIYLRGDASLA